MATPTADRPEIDLPEKDRYTYEDYQQLPEGAPYELIGGQLVMSPAPSPRHQLVQSNLFFAFSQRVRERDLGRILSAPLDVRLSSNVVVQPDLVFVSGDHLSLLGEQNLEGAPDLIVEVLSPSTAHRDLTTKKRLYEKHGVREYWVVDPETETVEVFQNTDEGYVQHSRAAESGSVRSTLLGDFEIDLADLF